MAYGFSAHGVGRSRLSGSELQQREEKRKRVREVYPTNEIPHLWAHQVKSYARNPQGNLYFRDRVIYSYGDHFAIAEHVVRGRRKAVLFNSRTYSVTTSQQQSAVRNAIPKDVQVFHVPARGTFISGMDAIAYYVSEINEKLGRLARVNSMRQYLWQFNSVQAQIEECKLYAKFFGLKTGKLPKVPELSEERRERMARFDAGQAARSDARWERQRQEWAAQEAERQKSLQERIEKFKAGEPTYSADFPETLLQVSGDEVITSRGARVPIDHARRGLEFVRRVVASGQEYVRNGHTLHLGYYSIDRIEANGTLHAGCHVISYQEIERIAPLLNPVQVSAVETQTSQSA